MNSKRPKQGKSSGQIADEIYSELRRILEIRRDAYAPIASFAAAPELNGVQRFVVLFDRHQPVRFAEGLKLGGCGALSLPDERISQLFFEFALGVWHLKDRLHQYAKATGTALDITSIAKSTENLRVCSDLANWKKHGAHENLSGLNPYLSEVKFDTSKSGAIELFYDGAMKRKGLIVTHAVPISFVIEVLTGSDRKVVGDAREMFNGAFKDWIPTLESVGLLSKDNRPAQALRSILVD